MNKENENGVAVEEKPQPEQNLEGLSKEELIVKVGELQKRISELEAANDNLYKLSESRRDNWLDELSKKTALRERYEQLANMIKAFIELPKM